MQLPPEVLKRWPRLRELEAEVAELTRRHQQAQSEVQAIENQLEAARRVDLDREAKAVRAGKESPKTKHEPPLQTKLVTALRSAEVYHAALNEATGDLTAFRAEHRSALYEDLLHVRGEIARGFAKRAREVAADFGRWSDMHYVLKDLTPPVEHDENTPAVRSSTHFIGVQTTQSSGPPRGHVESILAYLTSLAPDDEEVSEDAA